MKITETILSYMQENKITYRQVAAKTGRSAQNIWNVLNGKAGNRPDGEKGQRDPNFKTILDICEAIGMKVKITANTGEIKPEMLIQAAELETVSFSAVQRMLEAGGYSLQVDAPKKFSEENS